MQLLQCKRNTQPQKAACYLATKVGLRMESRGMKQIYLPRTKPWNGSCACMASGGKPDEAAKWREKLNAAKSVASKEP